MFRRFRVTPMVMTIAAGSALAQTPEGSMPVNDPPAESAPKEQRSGTVMSGLPGQLGEDGIYTVKQGDTLWDLSQSFMNNPWYWPKIWADNPEVENPHWIYPGNRLRIRQNGDGAPGEVTTEDNTPFNTDVVPDKKPELAEVSVGTLRAENLSGEEQLSGEITPYRLPDYLRVRVETIITDHELDETGVIQSSFEQKSMLSTLDKVYVAFNKPEDAKVNAVYSIFRPREEIVHPVSKERFGFQTELIGSLRILSKKGKLAVAEIGPVTQDVMRGDRITLGAALEKTVKRASNKQSVKGVILATDIPRLTTLGEHQVVFIDKGSKDGVEDGNTFNVVHSGDGLGRLNLPGKRANAFDEELPAEFVATLLVFHVRDHASAAMVMKSIRELNVGDNVEMRLPEKVAGAGGDAR
jgi:hypothetical protein